MTLRRLTSSLFVATALLVHSEAFACAVCYGDPDSDQVKGAKAGVLALLAFIVPVLGGIVGVIAFWTVRARRIAELEAQGPAAGGAAVPVVGAALQ